MTLGNTINKYLLELADDVVRLEHPTDIEGTARRARRTNLEALLGKGHTALDLPLHIYTDVLYGMRALAPQLGKRERLDKIERELESDYERRKRILENHALFLSRFGDSVGMLSSGGLCLMSHYFDYGIGTLAMGASAMAFGMDFLLDEGKKFIGRYKVAGFLLSCVPTANLAYIAMESGDMEGLRGALGILSGPLQIVTLGGLLPMRLYVEAQENPSFVEEKAELQLVKGFPNKVKRKARLLGRTLDAISVVQGIPDLDDEQRELEVAAFEQECVAYLAGDSNRGNLNQRIDAIRTARTVIALQTQTEEPALRQTQRREQTYDLQTFTLVKEYGLEDALARRIARTPYAQANEMKQQLEAAIGEHYGLVIQANPGILCVDGRRKSAYLEAVHRVRGTIGLEGVQERPVMYATVDGLARLEQPEQTGTNEVDVWNLESTGYTNTALVRAILEKGFLLGTGHPKIGMAYRSIRHIRNGAGNGEGVTSRDMRDFDNTFGMLIRDGVILTEKAIKRGGGGKYKGCYSVTPHLRGIKRPDLRQAVASLLYQ